MKLYIPVLLSRKRMVRFSCAVMETGSDGWLTTRLISSLPAEEVNNLSIYSSSHLHHSTQLRVGGTTLSTVMEKPNLQMEHWSITYRPWFLSRVTWCSALCSGRRAASHPRQMTPPPGWGQWPQRQLRWAFRALGDDRINQSHVYNREPESICEHSEHIQLPLSLLKTDRQGAEFWGSQIRMVPSAEHEARRWLTAE